MRVSKNAVRRAMARTTPIVAALENAIAAQCEETGEQIPGMGEAEYLGILSDELTRRPIPNRAEKRAAARRSR